jgi:hypothetical protein
VIAGLNKLAAEFPRAVRRGLESTAKGVHREAYKFLSGAGGAGKKQRNDYTGFTKKSGENVMFRSYQGAGGYPVPIRTGHLRRSLDWLKPGESKTGEVGTFTAGQNEVAIYDSAQYANVVHESLGSSAKSGSRRFLTDGLKKYNTGDRIKTNIEEEIQKEISKAGLK